LQKQLPKACFSFRFTTIKVYPTPNYITTKINVYKQPILKKGMKKREHSNLLTREEVDSLRNWVGGHTIEKKERSKQVLPASYTLPTLEKAIKFLDSAQPNERWLFISDYDLDGTTGTMIDKRWAISRGIDFKIVYNTPSTKEVDNLERIDNIIEEFKPSKIKTSDIPVV